MSMQRQVKLGFGSMCSCGNMPRAYRTIYDPNTPASDRFHLECVECRHTTPRFSTLGKAAACFSNMMVQVRADRNGLSRVQEAKA